MARKRSTSAQVAARKRFAQAAKKCKGQPKRSFRACLKRALRK